MPKEVSTNNRYKFSAIFIVFLGFSLNKLQRLFSDNSESMQKYMSEKIRQRGQEV